MRSGFKDCYNRFIVRRTVREPSQVQLTLRVDCEGRVSGIHATVDNLDRQAVDCLFATAAAAHFAEPVRVGAVVVQVPIRFVPEASAK